MEQYLQINFLQLSTEEKELIIALLSDIGFNGFDESDRQLSAFIGVADFNEEVFTASIPQGTAYTLEIIHQKNWNEEWERSFSPVRIDDYCVIRASFHQPSSAVHEIIITPKMSFGTGHHATTFLMISMMRQLDFHNASVLDFGTGTGVLAILAEREGANRVLAIDNDSWSIDNALENISDNGCKRVDISLAGNLENTGIFDIILANLNKRTLLEQLPSMEQHLSRNGVILVSGILKGDEAVIGSTAGNAGLTITQENDKDSWVALALSRKPDF